ncbi:sugar transferase [Mesorhizobium sp.]|uniref:sugar transferase n=1 Tax=Mesorhizobium sp. TaxID=1871066 RepID=UPI000FE30779|nr:sugar transferase [Mesorhizobium sp.]RWN55636.1 MAG: NAD-dependent epimerase/dehydratase family protein [Mesorhizobium sp.]RWN77213.1 MAG: NAD-dependent epimerase/dehydratase family protein [Mesorhizobium sp.]RWN80248.1 MAG: NAD-dependent epimerase/dehydratase family protein [Mesorhizobium sp.]RWN86161.1 MAG: NAD-dependent epimerase/dehydratase family protein [Mesorhizobium sp.]RWO14949.1 MAG: NAD-dependent epimerase/dehydratase family protein [Mesorhizobium sp.]
MRKIVITGATGFVGRQLIPLLQAEGAHLLLVSRDPARLSRIFPQIPSCGYDELPNSARGYDTLLHLAVINSNEIATMAEFNAVNVDFLMHVVEQARAAGVSRFLNVSSIHALNLRDSSPYAASKRRAVKALEAVRGIEVTTVYLPSLYAEVWSGKLSVLNRLPGCLARLAFSFLSAAKPTLHILRLAEFLIKVPDAPRGFIILSDGQQSNTSFNTAKRFIDLSAAFAIVVLLWWAMLLLWILIKLNSSGPGILAQERIGLGGEPFICFKFRTMKVGTASVATHDVGASAITPLGHYLRRWKLDELPQVWNIIRNDMSLVGPRPCLPSQSELIEARRAEAVLSLKPGITGLAQINGIDMSDPHTLAAWDARYGVLQSLVLDLKIIIATARGRGQGDRVRN